MKGKSNKETDDEEEEAEGEKGEDTVVEEDETFQRMATAKSRVWSSETQRERSKRARGRQ